MKRLRNICLKLEGEKKKVIEDKEKEKSDILKTKMKVEESLTQAIYQNKKLQVKDDTFTGIFDCLKELLKKNSEFEKVVGGNNRHSTESKNAEKSEQNNLNVENDIKNKSSNEENMVYVCPKCDFQSRRENIVIEHIKMDHSASTRKRIYVCDICEFQCENQVAFKEHCKQAHRENKYTCDQCGTKFTTLKDLDGHIQMNHQKKANVPCEHCGFRCYDQESLKQNLSYQHRIFSKTENTWSTRKYTHSERSANGFCKFWNNSTCKFQDSCKFVHEESPFCRFQESCRNINNCPYFHERRQQSKGFHYREEDFPPFQSNPTGRRV